MINALKVRDVISLTRANEFIDTENFWRLLYNMSGSMIGQRGPEWKFVKNIAEVNFGKSEMVVKVFDTDNPSWDDARSLFVSSDLSNILSGKYLLMSALGLSNADIDVMEWWQFNDLAHYVSSTHFGQINS